MRPPKGNERAHLPTLAEVRRRRLPSWSDPDEVWTPELVADIAAGRHVEEVPR